MLLLMVVIVLLPTIAGAQGNPLGPEFRANTFTTNGQAFPAVAADGSNGTFVVVWHSYQDGSGYGVFGQRYSPSGVPSGGEFRVNTYTTAHQALPSVAADLAGNFVVVWRSGGDGSIYGVFGQRYSAIGDALGPEFRVNTFTTSYQGRPVVASLPSGFVVVWVSEAEDGDGRGIYGQRYAGSGAPAGPEFRVNTYTTAGQYLRPAVAAAPTGDFVVAWTSAAGQDGSLGGVFGQRYASSGDPLGPEFQVNTYTTGIQRYPSVAGHGPGFVVLWSSDGQDGSGFGVFGQRYAASGTPLGPEFRVNTYTTGPQTQFSAASDLGGNFVAVWREDGGQDGSGFGVFGQRYAVSGVPLGTAFRVNSYTTFDQSTPSVTAADSPGTFVVVWTSDTQDASNGGVFGQRYAQIVPVELMRFDVK